MTGSPRWHPSRLLQFSIGLHAAAAIALALQPPLWPWWLGALLANHAALTAAGLWPRSTWLGPNLLRLPSPPRCSTSSIATTQGRVSS
jgi:peptidoglycan-N-acetylglucosamine deacetylase